MGDKETKQDVDAVAQGTAKRDSAGTWTLEVGVGG